MAYTWLEFKNLVKRLTSDGAINDNAVVLALSHFVKANIAMQVDKNGDLAVLYSKVWEEEKRRLLGYAVTLGDPALRQAVDKLITVDATRYGVAEAGGFVDTLLVQGKNEIAGQAPWYDNQIRQVCIELQHFIEYYRHGHETTYRFGDVSDEGVASIGELPEECRPQDAYYVRDGAHCDRIPIFQYDWENRFDLICGTKRISCDGHYMAIDPYGGSFVVFPKVVEGGMVSLFWDGNKLEFEDADQVPFDEAFAEACAQFLLWKIYLRPTTKDLQLAQSHEKNYQRDRLHLFRDGREKTELRFRNASPDPVKCDAPCSCSVTPPEEPQVAFV